MSYGHSPLGFVAGFDSPQAMVPGISSSAKTADLSCHSPQAKRERLKSIAEHMKKNGLV
jgi:hypothetical protein